MSNNNQFNQANFDYRDSSKVSEYVLNLNKQKLANEKAQSISNKWANINQKVLQLSQIDSKSELEDAIKELEFLRNEVVLEIENSEPEIIDLFTLSSNLPNPPVAEQP
jgi:hypothetical protein